MGIRRNKQSWNQSEGVSMRNAREEFITHVTSPNMPRIKCAIIKYRYDFLDDSYQKELLLHEGYSELFYNLFLQKLDFKYDDGYG